MAALTDVQMEQQIAAQAAAAQAATAPAPVMQTVPGVSNVAGSIAALNANIAAQQNYTAGSDTGLNAALAGVNSQIAGTQAGINQVAATSPKQGNIVNSNTNQTTGVTTTTYSNGLGGTYTTSTQPAAATSTGASSAFDTFRAQFTAMGLGDLANTLISLSQSPNAPQTSDGYYLALVQTPEYKARFGDTNAMRIANGLPALTEAQIMTNEQNYQGVMRQYGLPSGFYDQPADYQKFIALDKSPAEVASIIQSYMDLARQQDPNVLAQLKQYYNLDVSAVAANMMDPTKAQPIINALTQNGTTAAAASSAGISDITTAANMANTMGAGTLDYAKQAQAFAQAQQISGQATNLAQRYSQLGVNYNLASGLQEALSGPEAVQAQFARQRLATAETSQFGGSAGADKQAQSLGIASEQGVQ
jgi:hypothetical protein